LIYEIISSEIEFLMCAIAIGKRGTSSALAEVVVLLGRGELERRELGAFVSTIAEGLVFGQSTSAIVVLLANLQLYPK
jgi:hypothetical protein